MESTSRRNPINSLPTTIASYTLDQVLEAVTILLTARDEDPLLCHSNSSAYEPFVPHCAARSPATVNVFYDSNNKYRNNNSTSLWQHRYLLLSEEDPTNVLAFYLINLGGAFVCIAAVALIAGLFLGYLTLDAFDLRIIERASVNMEEREYASTILPIVVERHRVLVTLLILNGLAYETCTYPFE